MATHDVKKRYDKQIKAFGGRLKALREKKKISQEELAHRAGISFTSINKAENGSINPTLATLFAIADGLGISLKDLVKD